MIFLLIVILLIFSDIVDIHKYVMKKHNIKCLNYWSKCLSGGKSCQKYLIYDLAYKNPHMCKAFTHIFDKVVGYIMITLNV